QNRNRSCAGSRILAGNIGRIESRHDVAPAWRGPLDLGDYRGTTGAQRRDEIPRLGRAARFGDDRHRRHDCASSAHFDAFRGVNVVEDRGHRISFGISPLLARRILSRTSRALLEAIISRAASTPAFSDDALPPT